MNSLCQRKGWNAAPSQSHRKTLGFTLIELMVAVAVLAILSAIAYPSYIDYIKRGRIADALSPLSQFRLQMEQASQDNGNYGATACAISPPANTNYFSFSCTLGNPATTFSAKASGIGMMTGYAYTVDEIGSQKTTAYPGRSSLPASCWLTRPGDC
jgi:type IV pilus assembly protein PilE